MGFVNSAQPHKVTLKPNAKLPMIRQYNLPHRAVVGIESVIQSLLDQDVLVQTTSPCDTPILTIPKANRPDEWRFVQDLQAINNIVVPAAPIVPDTNSILASLPPNSTHYTVVDLSSAFFSIPLHPDSQYLFAFTFKGKQYTWQWLPQGLVESPTVYAAAVKRDLDGLHLPGGSTLLQYADDLLIASSSKEACHTDRLYLAATETGRVWSQSVAGKVAILSTGGDILGSCSEGWTTPFVTGEGETASKHASPHNQETDALFSGDG